MSQIKSLFSCIALAALFFIILPGNITANRIKKNNSVSTVDSLDLTLLNWYNADPEQSKIQGVGVDRVYQEILKNKAPEKKIVVAVIDGGVDINHEDLKGKIWTNQNEIPDNGIDDDDNGYVDDVHGWNFLGNARGENIVYAPLEYVRLYKKYKTRFHNIKSYKDIEFKNRTHFTQFIRCQHKFDVELKKYQLRKRKVDEVEKKISKTKEFLSDRTGKIVKCEADVRALKTCTKKSELARKLLINLYDKGYDEESFHMYKETTDLYVNKLLNLDYTPRDIISDNPDEIAESFYGNNNVKGELSDHGTFVAGIIAANRNNNKGINGIAENVELMVLRSVPKGDEYDKDIALSIRYAVDNGANIINMSFGKEFSANKHFVDEAVKYAEENNVLIVHSAGNDANNIDEVSHFPNKALGKTEAKNWMTIGANASKKNKYFAGSFSNYGRKTVDVFAPGVDIISLAPENKYSSKSGTSFSSPVVTGVAALLWSYYPYFTATDIKDIILKSSVVHRKRVYLPNIDTEKRKKKIRFKKLCRTGGVVNAYKAFQMAQRRYEKMD